MISLAVDNGWDEAFVWDERIVNLDKPVPPELRLVEESE